MILTYQTYKTLFILILMSDAAVFINARAKNLNGGSVCRTSDQSLGRCVDIASCPNLNELLEKIRHNRAPAGSTDFLRANICHATSTRLRVCCKSTDQPSAADVSECGKTSLTKKVIGGVNAQLFAWPWMAIIQSKLNGRVSFTCGGVLISERFVLTAAHCTAANRALKGVDILFVRLGEYDLRQDPDCKGNVCSENQDAFVGKVIPHPEYNKKCRGCDDIALIRLLDPITPNVLGIYPICMPTHFEQQLKLDPTNLQTSNKLAYIAGWGTVEKDPYIVTTPDILQEAEVPIQLSDYCTEKLQSYNDPNSVFCAGGTGRDSADSCRGDSGGPIMMKGKNGNNENAWYVIGIISRGPSFCGSQGTQSIFTNVTYYLPWILENMKI